MRKVKCNDCGVKRLNPFALSVKIDGKNIIDATRIPVKDSVKFFESLNLDEKQAKISEKILKEIKERLEFLNNVGLSYITLDRKAGTLSGGEMQRIRLATQIGSQLVGVLYVLDEPTIGLHQKDNKRLIDTLIRLRDIGNTLIVVEHDDQTMLSADWIIDLGPGAGIHGGNVIAEGTPEDIMNSKKSVTGKYLKGEIKVDVPHIRSEGNGNSLTLKNITTNNLKNIDITFPLGKLISVTGVSGSGKSSLVNNTLYPLINEKINGKKSYVTTCKGLLGHEHVDKVINIDQSPIGRTPRSNPATYTGLFSPVRELFASLPDAKVRGYKPGRFSFNVKGGRCEACEGQGQIKIEMVFLSDIYITCDVCKGTRYNRETLEVRYKGKNIAEVLDMSIEESHDFFENIPSVARRLKTLNDVGLSYIKLGQSATTLSGGEAQRIKLATELSKRSTGKTLYLLDEPTTGLHFDDVKKLIEVLLRFVDNGNTVIVIEHNLDVIKVSDWVIDLGPEGGAEGGNVVCSGTPEDVAVCNNSYTGYYLKKVL
jgi:excinuclease ABC subunit A